MNDDTTVVPPAEPVATDTSVQGTADSASVQVEEAPEAAPVVEATDVKATDTAEKLFAGKYKTVEELEKSYKELNSTYSRETQEKAELSRILSEAFAPETPTAQAKVTEDDYEDFQEPKASSSADDTVIKKLALMEFAMGHPDANGQAMLEVLKSDPDVAQMGSYEAKLRYAYALSKTVGQSKAVEDAKKQAQVDSQVKFAEKQAAQVESATKQSPPTDNKEPLSPHEIRSQLNDPDAYDKMLKSKFPGISKMMN